MIHLIIDAAKETCGYLKLGDGKVAIATVIQRIENAFDKLTVQQSEQFMASLVRRGMSFSKESMKRKRLTSKKLHLVNGSEF